MDNQHNINKERQRNFNSTSAIIALIAGIAAIAIGWAAYNRSGEDLEDQVVEQTTETVNNVQESAETTRMEAEEIVQDTKTAMMRASLEARLTAIQAQLMAEDLTEEARLSIADDIAEIRNEIQTTYRDASVEVQTEMQTWASDLDNLEASVRANTAEALGMLETMINRLKNDVATEEENE